MLLLLLVIDKSEALNTWLVFQLQYVAVINTITHNIRKHNV